MSQQNEDNLSQQQNILKKYRMMPKRTVKWLLDIWCGWKCTILQSPAHWLTHSAETAHGVTASKKRRKIPHLSCDQEGAYLSDPDQQSLARTKNEGSNSHAEYLWHRQLLCRITRNQRTVCSYAVKLLPLGEGNTTLCLEPLRLWLKFSAWTE